MRIRPPSPSLLLPVLVLGVSGALGCHAPAATAPAATAPAPTPSPAPVASGPEASAVTPAPAQADREVDAGPPVVLGKNIPPFGCAGVSADGRLAACVVGFIGAGGNDSLSLAFVSLGEGGGGATPPAAIDLWPDGAPNAAEPQGIPLVESARVAATNALKGFVALQAPPVTIDWTNGATCRAGGKELLLSKRQASAGGDNQAPRWDTTLTLRDAGRSLVVDEQSNLPLSGYVVRIYEMPAGLLISRTASQGDEGWYVSGGDAWFCSGGACRQAQGQ